MGRLLVYLFYSFHLLELYHIAEWTYVAGGSAPATHGNVFTTVLTSDSL